jgi:hypothetical protein
VTALPGPTPGSAPLPASEQARLAYTRRDQTDYLFDFWTAFGWTLLTCGVYIIYVVYQLVRRSRDHNQRRLQLLEAANAVAWERAQQQGLAEELRPAFERVAAQLEPLRRLTTEFRDPVVWLILAILARGIVELVVLVLLDGDLVRHDQAERAVEAELGAIYARLGTPLAPPSPEPLHAPQNYVGRVVAAVATCGVYTFFWLYDEMEDGNRHFRANWAWEDSLAGAIQAAPPPA